MSHSFRRIRSLCLVGGFAIAMSAGPVLADIPDNLTDIPHQSTEWGSDQLRMRGYTLVDSRYLNTKSYEYWWHAPSNTCVQARASGGRYEALKVTGGTDCNQYHKQAISNDDAAAIAVGAAAIIGAAVLAHKSHHRDDKHGNDSKSVADFDRGYRDGLYHQPYHNYQDTSAYSDGYNVGVRERHEQTRHRPNDGRYSGYHPYASVDDLVGASAASADSALRSRGFRDTGGYKQGGKSFVTWYNPGTRQCIQAVTKDGRIRHLDSINEGNCT